MFRSVACLLLTAWWCSAADWMAQLERKRFFELRDAVMAGDAPPAYRAVVACAFNAGADCPRAVEAALAARLERYEAVKMRDLLFDYHFLRGHWAEALAAAEANVAAWGEEEDKDNMRGLCRALVAHGPLAVERREFTSIRVLHKNAHVPFTVNGKDYAGFIDTGANFSLISEAGAAQLGLRVEQAGYLIHDASGKNVKDGKVAVADRFTLGNLALRNVPFMVVSDQQEPFRSWGKSKRAVIGLQVLFAAGNMAWTGGGLSAHFELARAAGKADTARANVCLDGMNPLTQGEYEGKRLTFFLDSGAGDSHFNPPFAAAFPKVVEGAPHYRYTFSGVGGSSTRDIAILKDQTITAGGRAARWKKLKVYWKGDATKDVDGMLGNDIMSGAAEYSLDFDAMRFTMR